MNYPLFGRRGTTLVELMAAMGLMSLVMTMAAGCILSGAALARRMETQSRARILLENVLEAACQDVENACGYIKIYESGETAGREGTLGPGPLVEYLDAAGSPTLLGALGCQEDSAGAGLLLRRTYDPLAKEGEAWYIYRQDGGCRACEAVIDGALYQGLFLKMEFSPQMEAVTVTASLYQRGTELVARRSVRAQLRHAPQWTTAVTAQAYEK